MAHRRSSTPSDLLADPGVLEPVPTLEVYDHAAVAETGGIAVLPHRGRWLRAREAGLPAVGWFDDSTGGPYRQAVVHLQKGRAATEEGLAEAWDRLAPGGRLLLVGGNDLGIKSAVKRLAGELGAPAEIAANRARARVACWRREGETAPVRPFVASVRVVTADDRFELRSAPGVFSADAVDPGTALLLEHLEHLDPPTTVFDPGCGLGVLGLSALRRWPGSRALLADVDHRAVACAAGSAADLGLEDRVEISWWDATGDPAPSITCDLALVNPPFHSGVPVDLQPARAIFRVLDAILDRGGRALVVANRTLPWERDLGGIGTLTHLVDARGYKILQVRR
ncbi:MAG: methyltransferase [Candidatus Sulfomarinibacteraceae bacterium]